MEQVLSKDDWRYQHKEEGYTSFELLCGLIMLASFALVGLALYAGVHFIAKYW